MDWIALLESNNIEYVTRGPNTKRGEVSVRCPWCGIDDPSQHLSISLTADKWGCWRNSEHRGKRPHRLIQALLNCSNHTASAIVGQYSHADPDDLDEALAMLTATSEPPEPDKQLVMPDEFRWIGPLGSGNRFWQYLERRGFDDIQILASHYRLRYASVGHYKDRIIFPLYKQSRLIGWTGRALADAPEAPRYLSSGEAIKRTVLWEDGLRQGGNALFIVEGPFDALKLDFYGGPAIRATCCFGTSASPEQITILRELSRLFSHTIILFDQGALEQAMLLEASLVGAKIGSLAVGTKDPGALNKEQVLDMVANYSVNMVF